MPRFWQPILATGDGGEDVRDFLLDPLRKMRRLGKFLLDLTPFHIVKDVDPFTLVRL